jgi:hypothetical protein
LLKGFSFPTFKRLTNIIQDKTREKPNGMASFQPIGYSTIYSPGAALLVVCINCMVKGVKAVGAESVCAKALLSFTSFVLINKRNQFSIPWIEEHL